MKLTQIQTNENVFIPGVGDLTKTINAGGSTKQAKFPGLQLTIIEGGVGVKITLLGKFAIVPWGNIKVALGNEVSTPVQPTIEIKADTSAENS
jgi:hypothetical protein